MNDKAPEQLATEIWSGIVLTYEPKVENYPLILEALEALKFGIEKTLKDRGWTKEVKQ